MARESKYYSEIAGEAAGDVIAGTGFARAAMLRTAPRPAKHGGR